MKKNKVLLWGIVFAIAVQLAACGSGNKDSASQEKTSKNASAETSGTSSGNYKGKSIAYLTPSLDVPFWCYMKHGIEDQAKNTMPGVKVTVYDSKDNANTQLANVQDAITNKVDGIVISPTDSASCIAVLSAAEEAGIPVVICDIGTDSGEYVSFISTDNSGGAKKLGEYVADKLNKGDEIAQIALNQARKNGVLRKEGFEEGIKEKLKEVDFRQMEKVNRDEGVRYTQDLITSYPNLKCIFCHSEDPSMGAVTALKEINNDKCKIVGFDCSPEVVEAIKSGDILATAAQQPVFMGRTAVDCLKTHLDGGTPEKEISVDTLLVTQDNINDVYDKLVEVALTDK
jgi:hypothetical protein